MRYNIYKGDRPSEGAQNLREALGGIVLRASGSTFTGRGDRALINWGCRNSEVQRLWNLANPNQRLNDPLAVDTAGNKLQALIRLGQSNVPIMPFWDQGSIEDVFNYVRQGGRVYARRDLRGHSGSGIALLMNPGDRQLGEVQVNAGFEVYTINNPETFDRFRSDFSQVQLFTQGIQGIRREWRIHVFQGRIILTQLKLRSRDGFSGSNSLVRNLDNGWIYSVNFNREDYTPDLEQVEQAAIRAVQVLGLDFGAVDLIYRPRSSTRPEQVCVLEVNTAPGLEQGASTLQAYTRAIQQWGAQVDSQRVQAR